MIVKEEKEGGEEEEEISMREENGYKKLTAKTSFQPHTYARTHSHKKTKGKKPQTTIT